MPINRRAGTCMFKWISRLLGSKPAKVRKRAIEHRKPATAELEDAAAEMGVAAAGLRQAAARMNAAAADPASAKPPATETKSAAQVREEIIRQAMEVRREKARAIEDLPAKDRERLRALAEKMMGTEAPPPQLGTPPRRRTH